jgi:hypothetical protein
MIRLPNRPPENGYVLLVCLAGVLVMAILVLSFLSFTQATEKAAIKRKYQEHGEGEIEIALMTLRGNCRTNFGKLAMGKSAHCQSKPVGSRELQNPECSTSE